MGVRKYFDFVRFEHTVFALPFALASMAVAAQSNRGWPGWRTFLLILAANRARDRFVTRQLRREGWRVVRIWEHELAQGSRQRVVAKIRKALR